MLLTAAQYLWFVGMIEVAALAPIASIWALL
jgi:hypothetical protein